MSYGDYILQDFTIYLNNKNCKTQDDIKTIKFIDRDLFNIVLNDGIYYIEKNHYLNHIPEYVYSSLRRYAKKMGYKYLYDIARVSSDGAY